MDFGCLNPNDLEEYIKANSSHEDEVLAELTRHTYLTEYHPRMLSGPIQGLFLQLICKILKPKLVLEIGTFTGYSAIAMAKGLDDEGHIHTIEINDEISETTIAFFQKAHVSNRITLHVGDALDIIPRIPGSFDLILIDGDKRQYPEYFVLADPKLKVGGLLIADNVLWGGKVLEDNLVDVYTEGVKKFNAMIANDSRYCKVMLPLRDGITIARKENS